MNEIFNILATVGVIMIGFGLFLWIMAGIYIFLLSHFFDVNKEPKTEAEMDRYWEHWNDSGY